MPRSAHGDVEGSFTNANLKRLLTYEVVVLRAELSSRHSLMPVTDTMRGITLHILFPEANENSS